LWLLDPCGARSRNCQQIDGWQIHWSSNLTDVTGWHILSLRNRVIHHGRVPDRRFGNSLALPVGSIESRIDCAVHWIRKCSGQSKGELGSRRNVSNPRQAYSRWPVGYERCAEWLVRVQVCWNSLTSSCEPHNRIYTSLEDNSLFKKFPLLCSNRCSVSLKFAVMETNQFDDSWQARLTMGQILVLGVIHLDHIAHWWIQSFSRYVQYVEFTTNKPTTKMSFWVVFNEFGEPLHMKVWTFNEWCEAQNSGLNQGHQSSLISYDAWAGMLSIDSWMWSTLFPSRRRILRLINLTTTTKKKKKT
jgi:hypothetical protein